MREWYIYGECILWVFGCHISIKSPILQCFCDYETDNLPIVLVTVDTIFQLAFDRGFITSSLYCMYCKLLDLSHYTYLF